MKVKALTPISHDGKAFMPGDTLDVDKASLAQLLEVGAVEPIVKTKEAVKTPGA